MREPFDPDPRSPEGRMVAYAIDQGYLQPSQLEQARGVLRGHPAGRDDGALLRLLRARYLTPEHVSDLRRYYQKTKAQILREAEEAALEVLSISDILVAEPFSVSDTGEVETVPIARISSGRHEALPPRPGAQPARRREPPPPPKAQTARRRGAAPTSAPALPHPADEPVVLEPASSFDEQVDPAALATDSPSRLWWLVAAVVGVLVLSLAAALALK